MAALRIAETILDLDRDQWNRCFPDELEDYDYSLAVEQAGVPGFVFRYFALAEGDRLLAILPAFITEYRLDTTVQGTLKRLGDALDAIAPWATRLKLVCFGSPVSEICHLGIAPEVVGQDRAAALAQLLAGLELFAGREKIGLMGIKDVPAANTDFVAACAAAGYRRMASLPTAWLDLPYAAPEDYLRQLSRGARKDLRRKMKAAEGLRFEARRNIDDVLDRVGALYEETLAQADLHFERLPPAYFSRVLENLGDRASCVLTWQDERLVAFNLLLHDDKRVIDKFLGMHYPVVHAYNLYFATWMANVRFCIDRKIPLYQSGQGGYGPKRHLGSRFTANWLFFRHRRPWVNGLLGLVARVGRLDRFHPDLTIAGGDGQ